MEKKKLSLLTKISYGASEVGAQFSWMLICSFLSVFYTDAVGISTLAVSMIPMLLITLNKKKADANEQTLRERREAGISE